MMKEMKPTFLKWFLVLSGMIQICYFGFSHLLFPSWYLQSVGISMSAASFDNTLLFINEIGVLAIGIGVATILAASDPVKNIAVIITLYIVSVGSALTSSYHILFKGIASGEWFTVIIIAIQLVVLTACYPWKDFIRHG